jgi:hypothetical protein
MKRAVVVADGPLRPEAVLGALTSSGFEAVTVATLHEARFQVETGATAVVAGINGAPWDGDRVTPINTMLPAVRRSCVVVLVGPGLATGDAAKAFLLNVDLVVSATDAARLGELVGAALALKRHLVAAVDTAAAARLGG